MTTTNKLPFLDGLKIDPDKIPKYPEFDKPFEEPLNRRLVELLFLQLTSMNLQHIYDIESLADY
jgi:hypothetical protein